jgi:hypothetical protein
LLDEQDKQLAAFDEETDQDLEAIVTCTASPQLLFLQKQVSALLATKRYEEADNAIKIAKAHEEDELASQKRRFEDMRSVKRMHLLEGFQQALDIFDEKTARNRLKLEQELKTDVESKKRAVENLQGRLETTDAILEAEATRATTVRPLADGKRMGILGKRIGRP